MTATTAKPAARILTSRPSTQAAENIESDFIANPSFSIESEEEIVLSSSLQELNDAESNAVRIKGKNLPEHLLRMCETRLLRPEQERDLFRRMNYAKFRVSLLRRQSKRKQQSAKWIEELARWEQMADADRNRLIRSNVRLVVSIAKKFANKQNAFDDLLSEGIDSLLRAVEKFDYDRGFRFSTYATQAIRRTLYRTVKQTQLNYQRFVAMEVGDIDQPDESTVAGETSMPEKRWDLLKMALQRMLAKLDVRERTIVRHRFGLDKTREVITLQELARQFGVCKERVRQLEQRAIEKLRQFAEAVDLRLAEA